MNPRAKASVFFSVPFLRNYHIDTEEICSHFGSTFETLLRHFGFSARSLGHVMDWLAEMATWLTIHNGVEIHCNATRHLTTPTSARVDKGQV